MHNEYRISEALQIFHPLIIKEMSLTELNHKIDQLLCIPHMLDVVEALKIEAPSYKNYADAISAEDAWGSPDDVWRFWVERYIISVCFFYFNKTHCKYLFIFHTFFTVEELGCLIGLKLPQR